MKTIFVIMDSLNRHYLNAYGGKGIQTPNIDRLAKRGIVFDNHYSGSLPCMPARREMMTGRLNFMESPWGPIEPWDDCLPVELRKQKGTYSHMVTDHYHYFHSGGEAYHTLFDTWEFQRGQESDKWHPIVKELELPDFKGRNKRQYWVNRGFVNSEKDEDYPTPQCFIRAMEFLDNNYEEDNWHLHLEVFDPHEPFVCPQKYKDIYDDDWDNRYHFDWPNYAPVEEEPEAIKHIQRSYAGVLTMTDFWLGKLLDKMDELDLWKDTTLVLTSDHGHLLGEHGYWGKNYTFVYQELSHIPLIICTPSNSGSKRVKALTATMDIMPTIMQIHNASLPQGVHGKSLVHLFEKDEHHHDAVLYGYFARDINLFDGHYSYCRQPVEGQPAYDHTAMPRRFVDFIETERLEKAEIGVFLKHCHNIPHYRIKDKSIKHHNAPKNNLIYDVLEDPGQTSNINDDKLEKQLASKMINLMKEYDAPDTEFQRMGFEIY